MKKLFLYVVLGLMFCNVAISEIITITCKRNLWYGADNFTFHFGDSKVTIIVDRNQTTLEETMQAGIATLVYGGSKNDFIIDRWGGKYDFVAYRYSRVDSKYHMKEYRKKYKGQLSNLDILYMEQEGLHKPTVSGELFFVDLDSLHDISDPTSRYEPSYARTKVKSFICSDSF